MIVSLRDGSAAVVDRDDLTRLHVAAPAPGEVGADVDVDAALRAAGLGRLDGADAWLSVDALRTQGAGESGDWSQRFAAMIDFARGKGWCSPDGTEVRAHVERASGSG